MLNLLTLILVSFTFFSSPLWAKDDESPSPKAIYYTFPEPITINFIQQSQKEMRLLQVKVALMSYDQTIIDAATQNLPMLQDSLRTLFTEQTMEAVSTIEGRKGIQETALKTLKSIFKQEIGKDNIEAVYFTSFIMQ
ncbi:MAG: flagellar basal body-associated FliL family protein [Piscirickettsiaceae bacterium]|nr:flagellar basal body-associated FliL family protein [Piscirickettsiaceae bacterium]